MQDYSAQVVYVRPDNMWYEVKEDKGESLIVLDELNIEHTITSNQIVDKAYV